jgi:hypothetical protein
MKFSIIDHSQIAGIIVCVKCGNNFNLDALSVKRLYSAVAYCTYYKVLAFYISSVLCKYASIAYLLQS